MKISCPHCGQHFEGDEFLANPMVECPGCGTTFAVSKSSTESNSILEYETQETASEKPTMEQWIIETGGKTRRAGLQFGQRVWSALLKFVRLERKSTTDVSMFGNDAAAAFELKRLFPVAVCCLFFGWLVGVACSEEGMTIYAEDRFAILPFGFLMCWFVIRGMLHFIRPKCRPWTQWILIAAFTATIGIFLLLFFQYCVGNEQFMRGISRARVRGTPSFFKYIIKIIGWCYGRVSDPEASMPAQFAGYVGGVGFCEEAIKLLPVFLLIFCRNKLPFKVDLSFRSVLMLGLFSGLGFGIAEALSTPYCLADLDLSGPRSSQFDSYSEYLVARNEWKSWGSDYVLSLWRQHQDLGSQIIRWFSCVPSHAIYATIDAAFLWMFSRRILETEDEKAKFGWFAACVAVVAILHGIYDTLCSIQSIGLFLDAASLFLLWIVVRHAARLKDAGLEAAECRFSDFDPETVKTFGKSFAKTYLIVGLCMLIWCWVLLNWDDIF